MRLRHYTYVIFSVFAVAGLWGCAAPPDARYSPARPAPVTAPLPPTYAVPQTIRHTVGPAETLWRISRIYNVDMETIMRANNISDPTFIRNGQKLVIPNTYGPVPVIPLYPNPRWTHIVIHHTATETGDAHSIDALHHRRGFKNGLGYHFLIDNGTNGKWDGQIEVGPRWIKQMVGAHTSRDRMNERGIGISLIGNYSETYVTEASLQSLVYLVRTLQRYYGIPESNVLGHRDVRGMATECPGNNFPWAEFQRRLALSR